jgi:type III secretion system (T3SS) SseB-like protein
MQAAPDDDAARLRFFERVGDAELFLLLEGEAEGDRITPQVFDPGTGPLVLAFDREERLAGFVGSEAPYAALSGRVIAALLADQQLGLGLNLDVAPSSFLLDADGVRWLARTLGHGPDEVEARLAEVSAPAGLPDTLIAALDTKLATATGLAQMAYLVGTTDVDGHRGHLLAIIGTAPGAEPALARAASEALVFSGIEAGAMDVGFFDARDPVTERLSRVGLRFDLPQPAPARVPSTTAPGSDKDRPPRLR